MSKRPSLKDCLFVGRALLELGRAENLLDEKRRKKSQDFDFRSSANPSAETTLLRLLVNPDDVSFDGLSIEDFGVRNKYRSLLRFFPLLVSTLYKVVYPILNMHCTRGHPPKKNNYSYI